MRGPIFLACVMLSLWLQCALVRAQAASDTQYDALVREAVGEYNAGNWVEARLLFGKAHELQPNARTWRGMGLTDYESKRYVEACAELDAALQSAIKPLTREQRSEVERALERSQRFVAIYTLKLPADATALRVDDKPLALAAAADLQLNPGRHQLVVQRASGTALEHDFDAEAGSRGTLELDAQSTSERAQEQGPQPAPKAETADAHGSAPPVRLWTWVAAGTTVAFGAATIVSGVLASSAHDDFEHSAPGSARDNAKRDGQRYQTLANIGIAATSAAAVCTVIAFVLESGPAREAPEAAADHASASVSLGLGALTVRGAF